MHKSSVGHKSSMNPSRQSTIDRDEKNSTSTRSEPRGSIHARPVRQSGGESSQIPRPRIRSASSDRVSNIRSSNMKAGSSKASVSGVYALATPVSSRGSSLKVHPDLPTGYRARSPSAERASGMSNNAPSKKDTRPLTDKSYQVAMLNRIDTFFHEANQSSILNPSGSLKPVSLKIFVSASNLLLNLLDIKHDLTISNYMDELPKIAKKLHYPGAMAKSWLKTANTMHSWHHVLGWLSWLVEICEVKDLATEQFQLQTLPFTANEDSEVINRDLFIKILELYEGWNKGNEDEEPLMIQQHIEQIAQNCGFTEEDLRIAELELEEANKRNDDVAKQDFEIDLSLVELNKELQELIETESVMIRDDDNRQKAIQDYKIEIQKLEKEFVDMDEVKERHLREHEELKLQIKQQSMSVEERDSILKQCTDLQRYINQFNEHLDGIEKEGWSLDLKLSKVVENLRKAILAYNTDIVINIAKDEDQLKMPESTLQDPNIMDRLTETAEAMMNLEEKMKKQLKNCQSTIDAHTNKLESLEDQRKMLIKNTEERLMEIDKKRNLIKNIKLHTEKEENNLNNSIKKLEDNIKILQQSIPKVETIEKEIEEATEKLDAVKRRKLFLERSAAQFFTKLFELIGNDRKEILELMETIDR